MSNGNETKTAELPEPVDLYKTQPLESFAKTLIGPPTSQPGMVQTAVSGVFDFIPEARYVANEVAEWGYIITKGARPYQQDLIVVDTNRNAYFSGDGMGGELNGELASRCGGKPFKVGFRRGLSLSECHYRAHLLMKRTGVGSGGACYTAGQFRKIPSTVPGITLMNLDVCHAGDSRLILGDENYRLLKQTQDQDLSHMFPELARDGYDPVLNAITGEAPGDPTPETWQIRTGWTLVAGSDGLTGNMQDSQEILDLIKGLGVREAVSRLYGVAIARMLSAGGAKDNINIIVVKIL